METTEPKALERKIKQEYNKDGLLEFIFGLAMLLGALMLFGEQSGLYGLFPLLVIGIKRQWRKTFTYPRLGYMELNSDRRDKRIKRVLLTMGAVLLAIGALFFMLYLIRGEWGGFSMKSRLGGMVLAGIFSLAFMIGALVSRSRYHFLLALTGVVVIAIATLLDIEPHLSLMALGIAFIALSMVRLFRFMRANPKLEDEAIDVRNA